MLYVALSGWNSARNCDTTREQLSIFTLYIFTTYYFSWMSIVRLIKFNDNCILSNHIFYIYIITFNLVCLFGNLSKENRKTLERVRKVAQRTVHTELPTIEALYEKQVLLKIHRIMQDYSHPLHDLFKFNRSGIRLVVLKQFAVDSDNLLFQMLLTFSTILWKDDVISHNTHSHTHTHTHTPTHPHTHTHTHTHIHSHTLTHTLLLYLTIQCRCCNVRWSLVVAGSLCYTAQVFLCYTAQVL